MPSAYSFPVERNLLSCSAALCSGDQHGTPSASKYASSVGVGIVWRMVAPYVLTYAGLYAVDLFVPDLLGTFLDAALVVAPLGAIATNLLSSIGGHLVTLGLRQA